MALLSLALPSVADARRLTSQRKSHRILRHRGAPVDRNAEYSDLVIEAETGRILHATEANEIRHPASLTKMMTLYLTFQALETGHLRLDQRLWVSSNASQQSPTKLGLRPGQSIRVEDALLGLVTESANDAAVVLAEGMGGSEDRFAELMTRQARALGMSRTTFQNPSGLPDPDQVTTAADMVRLGFALVAHYPQYYSYFSTESFSYAGRVRRNHNRLMARYDGMDGIKTGYIRASGFNLVASAVRGRTRLIAAIFGGKSAASRDNQMEEIMDQSFAEAGGYRSTSSRDDTLRLPAKVNAVFAPTGSNVSTAFSHRSNAAGYQPVPAPSQRRQYYQNESTDVDEAEPEPRAPEKTKTEENMLQRDAQKEAPLVQQNVAPQPARPLLPPDAPPVQPQPTLSAGAVARDKWGIQIGAFTDSAVGQQALANVERTMARVLGEAEPILQQVVINKTTTYRARFMNLSERTARGACAYLVKQRQNCLVVLPPR